MHAHVEWVLAQFSSILRERRRVSTGGACNSENVHRCSTRHSRIERTSQVSRGSSGFEIGFGPVILMRRFEGGLRDCIDGRIRYCTVPISEDAAAAMQAQSSPTLASIAFSRQNAWPGDRNPFKYPPGEPVSCGEDGVMISQTNARNLRDGERVKNGGTGNRIAHGFAEKLRL